MNEATATWNPPQRGEDVPDHGLALALVAYPSEPARVGEVALLGDAGDAVLGRHGTLDWVQQRPGATRRRGSLTDPQLSRQQVRLVGDRGRWTFDNLGKLPLFLNGHPVAKGPLEPGDVLQIADRVLLYVTQRPPELPGEVGARHRFGEADAQGVVGESLAAWSLRERLAFLARRDQHVLVLGESGTGKELVARALHALSGRSGRALVSRNAATIPESLADAELFGNLAGYPNPGMPARPGLVGEADGGVLFLDEFGELPLEQQARLLRVMDAGEYTRLGDARPRTSDLRLVAATNRDPESLKHDVLARFPLRVQVPPLHQRREDIPLIALHTLRAIASDDAEIAQRYFDGGATGTPRVSMELMRRLVVHPYHTHVRELASMLWQAITSSVGDRLEVPPEGFLVTTPAPDRASQAAGTAPSGPIDPLSLDPEVVQQALDRHHGRQDPVWRELGLASRHVLARFVKKHGLRVRGRG
ncbi:MAG: sigma 54-interacting transcriptional regulator [Alphaproteobacteria bacterium]|nr:sigma 54-interacting transcriptional regulator [Alphaproteobacteria bacterium]